MARSYIYRYKVLSGPLAGEIGDGVEIGQQDYPDQFIKEGLTSTEIASRVNKNYGIWMNDAKVRIERSDYRSITITEEGVIYGNDYMDLCVPFDRYGVEIKVGDNLIVASKNEARRVRVVAIAKKPYIASYGIMNRKLTVRDDLEDQTLTINDPRSTVKV